MIRTNDITINDITFSTLDDAAEHFNVSLSQAEKRLRQGWDVEQALEQSPPPKSRTYASTGSTPRTSGKSTFQTKSITANGNEYASISEFAEAFGMDLKAVKMALFKKKTPEEIIHEMGSQEDEPQQVYTIDGVKFDSLDAVADKYDAHAPDLKAKLNRGMNIEEAVGLALNPDQSTLNTISLSVDGKSYASINEIAEKTGIDRLDLISEISRGKNTQVAVDALRAKQNANKKDDSETIVVNGKEFKSLHQVAKFHDVNVSTFYALVQKKNMSAQDAINYIETELNTKTETRGRKGTEFVIQGKKYGSMTELASSFDMPPQKLNYRLKNGYSPEQAVGLKPKPKKSNVQEDDVDGGPTRILNYQGRVFKSVRQLAAKFECNADKVRYRLRRGWNVAQAIDKAPPPPFSVKPPTRNGKKVLLKISDIMPVEVEGQSFNSATELATAYDKNIGKVTGRLKNGWSPEEAVDLEEHKREHNVDKDFTCEGKSYPNARALADAYDKTHRYVSYRMSLGATPEQAVGLESFTPDTETSRAIEFRGTNYPSLLALAEAFNVKYTLFISRRHRGWSLEDSLELTDKARSRTSSSDTSNISIDGNTFKDSNAFAKFYDLDPLIVEKRMNNGWSPQRILDDQ